MRCGICGNTEPTYENRGYMNQVASVLPVYDAGDLVTHKRQQHPEEYAASMKARKDTKAAHERADQDYHRRRGEAAQAVERTVVFRWPYGDYSPKVTATSGIDSYNHLSDYRYPEPLAFKEYNSLLESISALQEKAASALLSAFEHGSPVPQADVDQVRAAMDAVPVEPS